MNGSGQAAPGGAGTVLYPSGSTLAPEAPPHPAPPSGSVSLGAFVFIGLCAAAGLWLWWRRRQGGSSFAPRGARSLAIAETRALGNRQYLVVASYEDRKFLLGVCPGSIQLLSPLDPGAPSPR